MEKKEAKNIGHISDVTFEVTKPLEFKQTKIAFNKLTLLVGANGSGKTFVNINVYCLCTLCDMIIAARLHGLPMSVTEQAQFIWDRCFSDQNIHGKIGATFQSGADMSVVFEEGKVKTVEYSIPEEINSPLGMAYMSSRMRTFNAISLYLKLRKRLEDDPQKRLLELMKDYKMFDVMYIEKLILRSPMEVRKDIASSLLDMGIGKAELLEFGVDEEKCDFYGCFGSMDNKIYLSSMSAGEQAMINMTIGASL